MVDVDDSSLQTDSEPKLDGLISGLAATALSLHSWNQPDEISRRIFHLSSTIDWYYYYYYYYKQHKTTF